MKTLRKTTFLLLYSVAVFAQQSIQGKLIDEAGNPIAYANIGFVNSPVGTVSNDRGEFKISLTEPLDQYEQLRISMMGFATIDIQAKELSTGTAMIIEMKKEDIALPEVVVYESHNEIVSKGNESHKSIIKTNLAISSEPNMNLGAAIGRRFHFGKTPTAIKKLHVYIAGNNFDTVLFRIQLYSLKNGRPYKLLHGEPIMHEVVNFRKGWLEIDLSQYDLVVNQDVAACIEWVGASERGNALFLNMNFPAIGQTHYYRFGAQNKWKVFHSMSTSMYLSVAQ